MYIGNDLQVAESGNKIIDDISSSFNGSTTSFALTVGGYAPVPFPINTQQIYISVNGVIQEPDPSGSAGFKLLGNNIVFSSAPGSGQAFFGVILSGADYVTVGTEFPAGSATAPSMTFIGDTDTGLYSVTAGTVGFTSDGTQTFTMDGNGFNFPDGKKINLGSSSDLEIYHSGSSSFISDVGTGSLKITSNGTGVDIQKDSSETLARFIVDGSVELYEDNTKRFETSSTGTNTIGIHVDDGATHDGDVTFTGAAANVVWDKSADDLIFNDNAKAAFGTSSDLTLYHDGTNTFFENTTGDFLIRNSAGNEIKIQAVSGEQSIIANANGSVDIYHDNAKKFETKSDGVDITGELQCDSLDVDGAAEFTGADVTFYGASTNAYWDQSTNRFTFEDDTMAAFGSGQDLAIYHDGSNSYLGNATGDIIIENSGGNTSNQIYIRGKTGENSITVHGNGAVELYHDDSVRIATTADGADFSGTGSIKLPVGTTAQRNSSPTAGDMRYNSTTGGFEGYTSAWGALGGGATGGGSDTVFFENGQTVTTNYTITNNMNAGSFGPITINSGVTVTVGSGEVWTVV